jgi:hypothetical protein
MSSLVYPVLQGLTFEVMRSPMWHTKKQVALSGKRSTMAYQQYPLQHFELMYSILRDDIATSDLKALVGLFNHLQGSYDTFLFTDPDFHTVTAQAFGIGTGSAQTYQVTATYANSGGAGGAEIIQNFNGSPLFYDNGALIGSYTLGPTGQFTPTTPLVSGHTLTWTGSFYYRCAFDDDTIKDLAKFFNYWWTLKKIAFSQVLL